MLSRYTNAKWLAVGEWIELAEGKRDRVEAWVKRQYKSAVAHGITLERTGEFTLMRVRAPEHGPMPASVANAAIARGLAPEEAGLMYAKHEGCCHICRRARRLVVDHCHGTGKVRGMLCHGCNTAIGRLGDTSEGLMRAVRYLEEAEMF